MPRYAFGPSLAANEPAAPPAPTDLVPVIRGYRPGGYVDLTIPGLDPAIRRPTTLYVLALPAAPAPDAVPYNVLVGTPVKAPLTITDAVVGDVTVKLDGVQPGDFVVQTVLEFPS